MSTPSSPELPQDFDTQLLKMVVVELLRRLSDPEERKALTASDFREIRMLCESNSVSFASIRKGDFGKVAAKVAEEFPFDAGGNVVAIGGSGA